MPATFIPNKGATFTPTAPIPDEKDEEIVPLLKGNVDVSKLTKFQNEDGSFSSIESITVPVPGAQDGEVVLLQTVDPETGKRLSEKEARQRFDATGLHLGVFKNFDEAAIVAQKISTSQGINLDDADAAKKALIDDKFSASIDSSQTKFKFVPNEEEDNRARDLLPETLSIAGFGDTGIPVSPKVAAFLVNMGGRMSGSFRGIKQFFSDDPNVEAGNEEALRRLTEDPVVGKAATGGDIAGAFADPLLWFLPLGKIKSITGAVVRGTGAGSIIGFANPVEEGESRFGQTVKSAIASAIGFPVVSSLFNRGFRGSFLPLFDPKKAPVEKVDPVLKTAQKLLPDLRGKNVSQGQTLVVNKAGVIGTRAEQEAFKKVKATTESAKATKEALARNAREPVREAELVVKEISGKSTPNAIAVRDFMANGGSATAAKEKTITELIAQRRLGKFEAGNAHIEAISDLAGGAVGAATGVATAPEGSSLEDLAARALVGGVGGVIFVRTGRGIVRKVLSKPTASIGGSIKASTTKASTTAQPQVKVVGDVAEPIFAQKLHPQVNKRIASLATQFFKENQGLRDPSRSISDDIHRYVAGGAVPRELLAKHRLSEARFAGIWRAEITEHARALGQLSAVYRQALKRMTPEELGAIKVGGMSNDPSEFIRPFWKKLTDTWRASLVTQPATAIRNAITQAGRLGLDVMQAPLDHWLQRLTGKTVTVRPFDGIEQVISLFQRNKGMSEKVLAAFPDQKARLFQNYLSDVATNIKTPLDTKFWNGVQKGIDVANILNRTQEFIIRRAVFQSTLKHEMRNLGHNLNHLIKTNQLGVIPDAAVKKSVQAALDKTFAKTPARDTIARQLVDTVNKVPGLSLAFPFPRFMFNALKFQWEYSPLGLLSYLSKAERAAFRAGDMSKISKAVIGSAMLHGAMQARDHENAGEKWYEWTKDDGSVIDLRPFNPFATYLFVADILKRQKEGTLNQLSGNDIAQGFLSTNLRAGTGLFLLDNALNVMSKSFDEQKFSEKAGSFIGTTLAGFLTPLVSFRDAYDQYVDGKALIRDTSSREGFVGSLVDPIKSKIPGLHRDLPAKEQVTREGPQFFKDPLKRQFTGISERGPKNPVEKEFDKLGFDRREILAKTGDKVVDRVSAEIMGLAVETIMVPLVVSPEYKELTPVEKGAVLSDEVGRIRSEVRDMIKEQVSVRRGLEIRINKAPKRERLLLEEMGIRELIDEVLGPLPENEL